MARQCDSSITRVRPFFQPLLRRDPTGASWLPGLLRLGEANPHLGRRISQECGPLLEWVSRRKTRPERALRPFGIAAVDLEQCFECRLPPPAEFLRWLIENPQQLIWPPPEEMGDSRQRRCEELLGHHGLAGARAAQLEALTELGRLGASGSNGKWWAFEGFTHVDCLLETENLLLLIEGKRMEKLSASTRWFPARNQLLRNLEVARSVAREKGKEYAVILMAEKFMDGMALQDIVMSLPHLTANQRSEVLNHYLGCVTWSQALAEVFFPHTVEEAARQMLAENVPATSGAVLCAPESA